MKPLLVILIAAFLPLASVAQDAAFAPVPASEVVLADLLFLKRVVVVFADSPNDPDYIHQMELLAEDTADLVERDTIVVTDTNPADLTELRRTLRPRGFSLVILDKDGKTALRKPLPWHTREITHAIDKFPSRPIEVQERNPPGR